MSDSNHLLMFLASTRMAHAVLAEDRGDELVVFGRMDPKTPKQVSEDAAYWSLDYEDGSGNHELVVEHLIAEGMVEPKYEGFRSYFKVTDFGRGFALGAARNVILSR